MKNKSARTMCTGTWVRHKKTGENGTIKTFTSSLSGKGGNDNYLIEWDSGLVTWTKKKFLVEL